MAVQAWVFRSGCQGLEQELASSRSWVVAGMQGWGIWVHCLFFFEPHLFLFEAFNLFAMHPGVCIVCFIVGGTLVCSSA